MKRHTSLATLVAMSRDFIALGNLEGEITYLNSAARSLVGLDEPEGGPPLTLYDFFPSEAVQTIRNEVIPALLRDGWVRTEISLRHFRTGRLIPVDIGGVVVKDSNGTAIALGTVTRDLTEMRESEKHKAHLEMQLAQAQKMEALGRLTGGIAHDFNNSLTVILGYATVLENSGHLSERDRKALAAIKGAGTNSKSLVKQLMGFSRQQVIAPQVLDLNHVLRESEPLLKPLVGENIELRISTANGMWDVFLDSSQVNKVLMNLAANARDAMPDGGKLTLETSNIVVDASSHSNPLAHLSEYVLLSVSDTGLGMSNETITRIFEPFFTTKEKGFGTGLGLATVYGIVRQNHGFIDVDSQLKRGTTFRVHFPRFAGPAGRPHEKPAKDRSAPAPHRGTILLVEDDDLVRNMTAEVLKILGYRPSLAACAVAALEICGNVEIPIDLVVSDVILPEMKGTEWRTSARKSKPSSALHRPPPETMIDHASSVSMWS